VRPPSLGEHPAHVSVVGCYHYSVVAADMLDADGYTAELDVEPVVEDDVSRSNLHAAR
jgi:hypothetical protein